jgi:GT2 family glycosyltransferase
MISAIVINGNGAESLSACLSPLASQTGKDPEVIRSQTGSDLSRFVRTRGRGVASCVGA